MGKSIKLDDDVFWDASSIKYTDSFNTDSLGLRLRLKRYWVSPNSTIQVPAATGFFFLVRGDTSYSIYFYSNNDVRKILGDTITATKSGSTLSVTNSMSWNIPLFVMDSSY